MPTSSVVRGGINSTESLRKSRARCQDAVWARRRQRGLVYLESFVVTSWAEHLRQHERITRADTALEQQIRRYTRGEPIVRHLIYAQPKD
jgi:hypothetical protein